MMDSFTLGRVLWRSLFLQAAWNYHGRQNLGAASAILPALEKNCGRYNPALTDALMRYIRPFNTQPYMSGPILGCLVKMEEEVNLKNFPVERLDRFKAAMTASFSAIGDAFFWNTMLPAAAAAGCFWAVTGQLQGALVFLVLFNFTHLTIRIVGYYLGYRHGLEVVLLLERLQLPRLSVRLRLIIAAGLGLLAAWTLGNLADPAWLEKPLIWLGPLMGLLTWLLARLIRRGVPVETIVYGSLIILIIINYAQVI